MWTLTVEISKKNSRPSKRPFKRYISHIYFEGHLIIVSCVLMVGSQVVNLTINFFGGVIIPSPQLQMENVSFLLICRFQDLSNETLEPILHHLWFALLFWTFGTSKDFNFQSEKITCECWDSLSHTCGSVFESQNIFSTHSPFVVLTLITSPRLG